MLDACKRGWEALFAFLRCCRVCWSSAAANKLLGGKKERKNNNFSSVLSALLAPVLQQNQPEQTGNTPTPILSSPPPPSPSIFSASQLLHTYCCREAVELNTRAWREPLQTTDSHLHLCSYRSSILVLLHFFALLHSITPAPSPPFASRFHSSALLVCVHWKNVCVCVRERWRERESTRRKRGGAE